MRDRKYLDGPFHSAPGQQHGALAEFTETYECSGSHKICPENIWMDMFVFD